MIIKIINPHLLDKKWLPYVKRTFTCIIRDNYITIYFLESVGCFGKSLALFFLVLGSVAPITAGNSLMKVLEV